MRSLVLVEILSPFHRLALRNLLNYKTFDDFFFGFSRFHQQSDFQDLAKRFEYEFITPKKRELVSDITASRRERI